MNIRYDKQTDAIYFQLKTTFSSDSDEINEGVIIDYDRNNDVVGIEILDFQQKLAQGLTIDQLPFPEFTENEKSTISTYFDSSIYAIK